MILAATRAIRRAEKKRRAAQTPVIMVSANAMPEHAAASLAAGANRHVSKPVAVDVLLDALNTAWRDARTERAVA